MRFTERGLPALMAAVLVLPWLAACNQSNGGSTDPDNGSGGAGEEEDDLAVLAEEVRQLAADHGLSGDAAPGQGPIRPDEDPVVKLGQLLFFTTSLSGMQDTACASCHHPELAMGDALSLPVGTGAEVPEHLGPGRRIHPDRDPDPRADGGPNVPRNSQTIFNVSLYNRSLFHDGRLFVLEDDVVPGGQGQSIRTPESGNRPHDGEGDNLLEIQALFPLTSDQEMRGYAHPDMVTEDYRQWLVERIRTADGGPGMGWLARFQAAFPDADSPVTLGNIQRALAAYQASMLFVDSPWSDFLREEDEAVTLAESVLRGARLFLADAHDNGLGCVACHAGDRFTDEQFYNAGFPQIGRGKRQGGTDSGRWGVTREEEKRFAFRVPSLLNVAEKAPYGHAGSLQNLEDVIRWHSDPNYWVDQLDAFLLGLDQFPHGEVLTLYPEAENLTRAALNHESFELTRDRLPDTAPSEEEIADLVAFLDAMTDPCIADTDCLSDWTPAASEDPDGNLLVRDQQVGVNDWEDEEAVPTYPDSIALNYPQRAVRDGFPDTVACDNGLGSASNTGEQRFVRRTDLGLDAAHGFTPEGWMADGQAGLEPRMFAGGISALYLSDDCWVDLVFTGGEESGLVFYENQGNGQGYIARDWLQGLSSDDFRFFTNVSAMDLNGDHYLELLLSNISSKDGVWVLGRNDDGRYEEVAQLPLSRSTWGMAFSPFGDDAYPGLFMAHWSGGVDGLSPALWTNENGERLVPFDEEGGTSSAHLDQRFNFGPIFADFTGNGRQDLVIASDFETSATLQHTPDGRKLFTNVTNRGVITDENGMGAVVGDFDNNGKLDWFVTSVHDRVSEPKGNWGVSGNRLYRNVSDTDTLKFEDATEEAGVREGGWGWGACAADFNNNGFLDIFHVNGFGDIPSAVEWSDWYAYITGQRFIGNPPVLFINNGDGSFTRKTVDWDIDVPSQGTGVSCFDHDRDGDVDIVLVDNSTGIQFFESQVGHGVQSRFMNIRLVGEAPNTLALGARVMVTADVGNGHGVQEQLRESTAHSSFNGQNPPDMHFGLGEADTADIRVRWPNGGEFFCEGVSVNRFLIFDQSDPVCP